MRTTTTQRSFGTLFSLIGGAHHNAVIDEISRVYGSACAQRAQVANREWRNDTQGQAFVPACVECGYSGHYELNGEGLCLRCDNTRKEWLRPFQPEPPFLIPAPPGIEPSPPPGWEPAACTPPYDGTEDDDDIPF